MATLDTADKVLCSLQAKAMVPPTGAPEFCFLSVLIYDKENTKDMLMSWELHNWQHLPRQVPAAMTEKYQNMMAYSANALFDGSSASRMAASKGHWYTHPQTFPKQQQTKIKQKKQQKPIATHSKIATKPPRLLEIVLLDCCMGWIPRVWRARVFCRDRVPITELIYFTDLKQSAFRPFLPLE